MAPRSLRAYHEHVEVFVGRRLEVAAALEVERGLRTGAAMSSSRVKLIGTYVSPGSVLRSVGSAVGWTSRLKPLVVSYDPASTRTKTDSTFIVKKGGMRR